MMVGGVEGCLEVLVVIVQCGKEGRKTGMYVCMYVCKHEGIWKGIGTVIPTERILRLVYVFLLVGSVFGRLQNCWRAVR